MIALILLNAVWGASLPLVKWLLQYSPPLVLASSRMVVAGLLLGGYSYFFSAIRVHMQRAYLLIYAQIIFFGYFLRYGLKYWGLQAMPAAKVALIVSSAPFFTALFSYIFLQEKLTKRQCGAITLGILGFFPVLLAKVSAEQLYGSFFCFSWPEISVIGAVAAHCYSQTVTRSFVRNNHCSLPILSGITMLGGGCLTLAMAYVVGESFMQVSPWPFITGLMMLIIITNIIGHQFYLHLLRQYSATLLSLAESLSPIFTAIYGYLLLGEVVGLSFYISMTCITIALYIFYKDERLCRIS